MEFKERLKNLRKERKLTQSDLADILNYGYTAISNYESGRNEPSISDLKKIAVFFDVSMDYLLCLNDTRNTYIETNDFDTENDLKMKFLLLNDENQKDIIHYMDWLKEKQNRVFQEESYGKVAETKAPYITRNITKDIQE